MDQSKFNEKQQYFNKKIQDLMNKNSSLTCEKQDIEQKLRQIETEKTKISEKWVRLSARTKVDERTRSKTKIKEELFLKLQRDTDNFK